MCQIDLGDLHFDGLDFVFLADVVLKLDHRIGFIRTLKAERFTKSKEIFVVRIALLSVGVI